MVSSAASSSPASIVVIEDEQDILEVLEYNLLREGYHVTVARDGREGLRIVRRQLPALVLLDLMLPTLDGVEVCRAVRDDPSTRHIPVIMLTAKGEEADIVLGLGAGADDYVTKPFSPREVVARVRAALRRSRGGGGASVDAHARPERVSHEGLVVDAERHQVLVDGRDVHLTRTELRLLHALASRPERVFTRDELLERVMGGSAWVTDRTIDVHIRAIRKKLGVRAALVQTVRGVGYQFREDVAVAKGPS